MKRRIVLPWRYLVLLLAGLAVLFALIAVFGRTDKVLIGWLVGWLVVSRGVDVMMRRRRRPGRDREP